MPLMSMKFENNNIHQPTMPEVLKYSPRCVKFLREAQISLTPDINNWLIPTKLEGLNIKNNTQGVLSNS